MSKQLKNSNINDYQDTENTQNDDSNTSTSSSDFEYRRKHKLRRKCDRNVSFHYQALPMRIVGDNSVKIVDIPSSSRDITLNSAQIIEDSSDSEFHISNDTSNDEPANKPITFTARALEKPDLKFIRKLRKRKYKTNKTLYIE
ncbi:uncharacterized protein LOC121530019 [Drosophila eugracilis]|uniref:uncharacterized protein LOC121530019 n=1 Tax=Drosophila eugracilis TaxID=29029 RepID=UPI001BDA1C3D|nr:uncharacterized protein LOC121530019 [Drosophila eugracilis]